jgi:glycerate dehydrogenase
MNVVACSESRRNTPSWHPFQWAALPDLLQQSDVVSLHCPLTDSTRGLINRDRLSLMRSSAILINTARGGLVIEQDLADSLNAGRLAAAGLDVVSREPIEPDNPLLTARNCLITPHIAWATLAARRRLLAATVSNVAGFLNGTPQNVVCRAE